MKTFFRILTIGTCLLWQTVQAQSLMMKITRKPVFDVSAYKQIGIGDIVGPNGFRNQTAMDLSDELTTLLTQKGSHEILDHSTLSQMARSKSALKEIQINENALAALSKKMQSAVMIVGRIQSETVRQQQKSHTGSISVNGCATGYWYETSGEFILQLRLLDVKTAKLIKAQAIKIPMNYEGSRVWCATPTQFDTEDILRKSVSKAVQEIVNYMFPYEETHELVFEKTLFAPFKDLKKAAAFYNTGSPAECLQILEGYAKDVSLKDKVRPMAHYNYALGLYATSQFAKAKEEFMKAYKLSPQPHYKRNADIAENEMRQSYMAEKPQAAGVGNR